ncbi:hypothetical protein [Micromonospora aurantiaca (nom. illeg.)]|uniref:hypothetical protein n=1 Tax=Micromonospora aurantiaca (nom. illeg.) TaxID=47850 RepID=UPI0033EDC87E
MTTVQQPTVGAAGFLAALAATGHDDVTQQGELAVFTYRVEVGRHAGDEIKLALAIPPDWPVSPPPGPHVSPRLGHPDGAVHASPLGAEWEYWSRPAQNWVTDRSMRAYLRHLRTLFARS